MTEQQKEPEITEGRSGVPLYIKSGWSFLVEVTKVVLISLAIIIPVRYFLFQPFYVKGASMEPTFFDNEYLIINEIEYRLQQPERGDIVVLKYPKDPSQYFIKRVVALPGETIEIKNGDVYIINTENPDGFQLEEDQYLSDDVDTQGSSSFTLSSDQYFVLGDNRTASLDSRSPSLGPVSRKYIIGKAWVRVWPLDRMTVFSAPQY